jgi:acetyltransferase-like isoleucine patch superfamily enzyme
MITKFIEKLYARKAFRTFIKEWNRENPHNEINPLHQFPIECVKVGKRSYGDLKIMLWSPAKESLEIGNYVSIASNVTFLLGGNHHTNTLMTFPSIKIGKGGQGSYSKGKIVIKDDVWIGYGSTILSGVTIGQGAVIGANSVVSKDIPPYAIAIGNPIQIVKYRFKEDVIKQLITLDYSNFSEEKALKHIEILNMQIKEGSDFSLIQNLFQTF